MFFKRPAECTTPYTSISLPLKIPLIRPNSLLYEIKVIVSPPSSIVIRVTPVNNLEQSSSSLGDSNSELLYLNRLWLGLLLFDVAHGLRVGKKKPINVDDGQGLVHAVGG